VILFTGFRKAYERQLQTNAAEKEIENN